MGAIIAIGIIWYACSRGEKPETRKKQRKLMGAATLGTVLWFFEGIWNADKYQEY